MVTTGLHSQTIFPQTNISNLRQLKISTAADSFRIDKVSIVPNSLSVAGIADSSFHYDFVKAMFYWKQKPPVDTVTLVYRVFPYRLDPVAQRMNYDSVMNNFYVKPFEFNNELTNQERGIFNFGTLKAEGSVGRQIGFGNNQDAVVNSTLNLQLSGILGDSIEIQAAITDNNIPIQPDGNTQQLNEFDQVFLQFRKRNWQLNLGDIDIRQDNSYFLRFYKRLQGVSFQTINPIGKNVVSKTLVSGSIAKGRFTRNIIDNTTVTNLEGNQGPYRLKGANNEIFFIILANTERVFLDGVLLQRGEDQDYVINYNTAEISFTPKRMITKDSRIQVEFEYAERSFLNANLYLSEELEIGRKLKLRVGAFNNSDAKSSQINQDLDTKQKQYLATIGDSLQKALFPSAVPDTFGAGKILYEKIYVGSDSFYQYSTDPATAKYNLSFIDVGMGRGNYVPDFNGANGKVYKYIAPLGNVKFGQYEPVIVLVTPKKQQLVNMGIDYAPSKNTLFKTELAMSNTDVNTYSKIDDGDDKGYAAKFQLGHKGLISPKLEFNTAIDYEYVQNKFKPLERLRNVEFSREWGLPLIPVQATENIFRANAGLKGQRNHSFSYQFINYHRSDRYNGVQHFLRHNFNLAGWQFNNEFAATHFTSSNQEGEFLRPVIDLNKELGRQKNWRIGGRYSLEKSTPKSLANDTLSPLAFSFETYTLYLRSAEKLRGKHVYALNFFTRTDKYPFGKEFRRGDMSYNVNLQAELLSNPKRQFYINTTFRKLKVYNVALSRQKEDETLLGRAEYVMNEWKGLLTGNLLYEIGAGQEQRRDYAYLEVPAGTGQFAWNDYNGDAVQQLNEFELAAFPDQAKFIRIFTPTNDFIKANYITFNYSFTINPRSVYNAQNIKGIGNIISRLNFQTSLQINKKSLSTGSFEFNPFKYGVNDTALITQNTVILNTLSFNRFQSKWGMDLSNLRNYGKSLLTYGYESRKLNDWILKWRWNLTRSFSMTVNGKKGFNALYTPKFDNRNYELRIYNVEPNLIYIHGTSFRLASGYKYETKKNAQLYGGEKSTSHSINLETKYNILQNSSITGKFTFNNIEYNFPANSTVSYIMLDGLLPGKNYLWSLGFTKRLLNNLEMTLQYDGRKPGNARTVHNGRAGITALF